jgi:hypothetical protein
LLDREPGAGAILLFAGFAVILVESLIHVASRPQPERRGVSGDNPSSGYDTGAKRWYWLTVALLCSQFIAD